MSPGPSPAMREATSACGPLVEAGATFLEQRLVSAFRAALAMTDPDVVAPNERLAIPYWDPQPDGIDLVVRSSRKPDRLLLVEAKVDDVDQMLWDLFKMAAASGLDDVRAVHLLAAARAARSPGLRAARWAGSQACAELFDRGNDGRTWDARWMLERWAAAWRGLLAGGRGRPTRVPARIRVVHVGSSPVPAFPGYEVRCIEIRVEGDEWLAMSDGRLAAG